MTGQELYKALSVEIPHEYHNQYKKDGMIFTGFNAQYAINILNEILGTDGWMCDETILQQGQSAGKWTVVMKAHITGENIDVTGYGSGQFQDADNAYKAAKTSAFKNACKYLGIGKELYVRTVDESFVTEGSTPVTNTFVEKLVKDANDELSLLKLKKQVQDSKDDVLISVYNQKLIKYSK